MKSTLLLMLLYMISFCAMANDQSILNTPEVKNYMDRLKRDFGYHSQERMLLISIAKQEMYLVQNDSVCETYRISSATEGVGSKAGSGKTPAGIHRVSEKFGEGAPLGTIFKARQSTGKIAPIITEPIDIPEDEVTTRILWLSGLEPGINKGGQVDSHKRFIYIHGTPEEGLIGQPASHGCIRMYNREVIELFSLIDIGTFVVILDDV